MIDAHGDRVAFARDVLGVEPFAHQEGPLRSTAAVVVVVGGRRSGKTLAAQVAALHTCFTRRGAQVLVTGPNEANVRERVRETTDCCVLCVHGDRAWGRTGRAGRERTYLHLPCLGWGPSGRWFKSSRPDRKTWKRGISSRRSADWAADWSGPGVLFLPPILPVASDRTADGSAWRRKQ